MGALSRREADLDDNLPPTTEAFKSPLLQTAFIRRVAVKNEVVKHRATELHGDVHPAQEDPPTQNQGSKNRVQQMRRGSGITGCLWRGGGWGAAGR